MKKDEWEIAGKPVLWTIQLQFQPFYDYDGNPAKALEKWHVHNQSWQEVRGFRESVFTHGFFCERSPGRGEIIFPSDFRKILLDVQTKGFKE